MGWLNAFNVLTFNVLTLSFILSSIPLADVKAISTIRTAMHSLTIKSEFDIAERRAIFHTAMKFPSPPEGLRWRLDLYSSDGELIKRFEDGKLPPSVIVWSVPGDLSGGVIYQLTLSFRGVDFPSTPRAILLPTSRYISELPKFRLQAQPKELLGGTSTLVIITPIGTTHLSIRPELCVMDEEGAEVWGRKLNGGPELVRWDGKDAHGKSVNPGVYICVVREKGMILSNFVILVVRPPEEKGSFFSSSILFHPKSAELTSEGMNRIGEVLSFVRAHPGVAVNLRVGISPGDPIRGLELAYKRVKEVVEQLDRASPGLIRITGFILESDEVRVDLVPYQSGNFFPSLTPSSDRSSDSP